jgi:hypothetical protein
MATLKKVHLIFLRAQTHATHHKYKLFYPCCAQKRVRLKVNSATALKKVCNTALRAPKTKINPKRVHEEKTGCSTLAAMSRIFSIAPLFIL